MFSHTMLLQIFFIHQCFQMLLNSISVDFDQYNLIAESLNGLYIFLLIAPQLTENNFSFFYFLFQFFSFAFLAIKKKNKIQSCQFLYMPSGQDIKPFFTLFSITASSRTIRKIGKSVGKLKEQIQVLWHSICKNLETFIT